MGKIVILEESLINKIAAGEVIERPSSVVKELVENSLDAGASKVFVEVEDGGKRSIKVSDDGSGMQEDDALICLERHSTSKIRTAEDLFSIHTLGFRGEALASIASVSRLEIRTRSQDGLEGIRVCSEGGRVTKKEKIGFPGGTTVIVEDLFFNTPARKKYLRPTETEIKHVADVILNYSIAYPDVHFRLTHNGKEMMDSTSSQDRLSVISSLFGSSVARELMPIRSERPGLVVEGFVAKPKISRSTKSDQYVFINERHVKKCPAVVNALNDAFHTMVMVGRYPFAIVMLKIDPTKVDVNVHPAKAEVRFQDEGSVYDAVHEAVRSALESSDLMPQEEVAHAQARLDGGIGDHPYGRKEKPAQKRLFETADQTLLKETTPLPEPIDANRLGGLRPLGIVHKTYIIAEMKDGLCLIDQHAAAERILYEEFLEQANNEDVKVQRLLEPAIIELSPSLSSFLETRLGYFSKIGYEAEHFGGNEFLIRTYPVLFGRSFDRQLFLDLVDELYQDRRMDSKDMLVHEKVARKACRSAIKAGDEISIVQVVGLINALDKKRVPYNCPHGRPILIKLSLTDLEKMFKRIV